jgi:hypothetical protein
VNIDEDANFRNFEVKFKSRNDSFIQDIFYGCFKSQTICPMCHYKTASYEPFSMLSLSITPQDQSTYELLVYLINEDDFFEATKVTVLYRPFDTLQDVRRAISQSYFKDHLSMQFYIFDKLNTTFSRVDGKMNEAVFFVNIRPNEMLLLVEDKPTLEEYSECVQLWFDLRFDGWKERDYYQGILPFKIFYFAKKVKVETLYSRAFLWMYKNYYYRTDDFYRKFSRGMNGYEKETRPFDLILRKKVLEFDVLSGESEEIELEQEQIIIRLNDLSSMRGIDLYTMYIKDYRDSVVISHINITSCLDNLTAEYSLDEDNRWKCGKCYSLQKAIVNLSLKKLPEVLIIHLKRFKHMQDGSFDKIGIDIQFPLQNLDLAKYLDAPVEGCSSTYDLYASINHRGSLLRGHYIALVHHFTEKKWYKFDDDLISEVRDPWSSAIEQPYILFYKRTN